MAKIILNGRYPGLRGRVGLVFRRGPNGGVYVSKLPDMSRVVPSRAQIAQRDRFADAAVIAHALLADPDRRAFYEAKARRCKIPVFAFLVRQQMRRNCR